MEKLSFTVVRDGQDEITLTEVSAEVNQHLTRGEFLERLQLAVTTWLRKTRKEYAVSESAHDHFNIGDLSEHTDSPSLKTSLVHKGIFNLQIAMPFSKHFDGHVIVKSGWTFDTNLNVPELLKEPPAKASKSRSI